MSELPNVPGGDAPDLGGITGGSDDHDVGKTASSAPKPQSSSPDQKDPNAGPVESTISPAAEKVGGDTGAELGKEAGKVAGEAVGASVGSAVATAVLGPEAAPIGEEMGRNIGGQIGSKAGEKAGRDVGEKAGHEVAHSAASPVDDQISGKSSDNKPEGPKPGGPKPGKGKLDSLDNQFEGAQSGLSSHTNTQESMTFSPMASGDAKKDFALNPEPPSPTPTHPKDAQDNTKKLR